LRAASLHDSVGGGNLARISGWVQHLHPWDENSSRNATSKEVIYRRCLQILRNLDILFTSLFTLELVLNVYGNWFWPFFSNGWNILDMV
jgi:hypothetical protein